MDSSSDNIDLPLPVRYSARVSTVISTGFRYTGPNGIVGCHEAFNGLRDEIDRRAVEKYVKFLANVAAEQIDRKVLGLKPELRLHNETSENYVDKPLSYAVELWEQRRQKLASSKDDPSTLLDHAVATDCIVHLFPVGRRVIGIFSGSDTEWMADLPFVSDYSYWNHSDRPDSISSREWSQRDRDWRNAFPTYPAERSLIMELHSKYEPSILIMANASYLSSNGNRGPGRVEQVLGAIPSTAQRAKLHSRSVILQRGMWLPNHVPETVRGDDGVISPTWGAASRLSSEFHSWRKTPEGIRMFEEVEAELALKLPIISEKLLKNNA